MRIGFQAWGSEGDIRPFLALGHALARAGHQVTLALTDFEDRSYARWEAPLGVRILEVATPVVSDPAELDAIGRALLRAGHPVRQTRIIHERLFEPVVEPMYEGARRLCAESDLVVGHFFHHPVHTAAEAAGVPEVTVTLAHNMIPSGALPPEGLPDLGPHMNRLWWRLALFAVDRMLLAGVNDLRERAQLPPVDRVGDSWHSPLLDLVAVSPTLCPPQPDWRARHRVCGFLELPAPERVDPLPRALDDFLASGPPPVFFGFGSLTPTDEPDRMATALVLEDAVARAGCRAVMQGLRPPGLAPDGRVLHVGRAPHAAVFPRCAGVVHHGGAGTTQTVLRSGRPSVVVPHVADQFFWGAELRRHRVATKPLPRASLTARALAERLGTLLADTATAARAEEVGRALAGEDGCGRAVALVEEAAGRARR